MRKLIVVIASATAFFAAPAAAQVYVPPPISVPAPTDYSSIAIQRAIGRAALRRQRQHAGGGHSNSTAGSPSSGRSRGGTATTTAGPPPPRAAGATTFRQVAPNIMPQRMAQDAARTPAERAKFEKMFSDLLENYRDRLKKAGLPTNDVARAASYLVSASYAVSHDNRVSLDDAQYKALREQMHDVFAADGAFQRMSDRERQELFESFGITGTWIDVGYNIVKQADDRKAMAQWREMARRNFENMFGVPPERVKFTGNGVEQR